MKKVFILLSAFFAFLLHANATHITGGDIQYRYVGDSTGVSHQYEVTLRVYRDCSPGTSTYIKDQIQIESSCYPTQNVSLTQIMGPLAHGEWDPPTYEDCVDPGIVKCLSIRLFKGLVTLPGLCSDYKFKYFDCCRPSGVDNIAASNTQGFYFEASLNNFLGNNSSAKFVSEPARAFCVGQNFNWTQSVIEADGDSLRYELISARENATGDALPYNAGYTPTQPITTNPPLSLSLDAKTGNLNFTPSQTETVVLALEVQEYRFDSTYIQWVQIGTSNRELVAAMASTCSQQAQAGVKLDYNHQDIYPDPVNGLPTVNYTCLDSSVTLHFATKLDCSTISPDGTDFRLTSPSGQPIPIGELQANCDVNNETNELTVQLYKPLAQNGKYFLYSKLGNDGNTLLNKCGFPMGEFDTIQLNVTGCFSTNIDMKNVTIVDDRYPRVEWELDTVGTPGAPFPTYLVDEYKIYRSDDNGVNYTFIYAVKNYKQMWFNDQSLGYTEVDKQHYKYKVEVMLNGQLAATTRMVNSIWLRTANGDPIVAPADSIALRWSQYPAWPNPDFQVYLGKRDGGGNWVDQIHNQPNNPTTDSNYLMINKFLEAGEYRVCVKARYPGGGGPYRAWSNCLPFNIYEPIDPPVEEPLIVEVPNVITPNGDGLNDAFKIKNIETWSSNRSVKIFNRWGKMVYQTSTYSNQNPWLGKDKSGKALADGVYFYVIDLFDAPSNTRDEKHGEVTITGSLN